MLERTLLDMVVVKILFAYGNQGSGVRIIIGWIFFKRQRRRRKRKDADASFSVDFVPADAMILADGNGQSNDGAQRRCASW